jgi:peroxiredoxin
LKLAMEAHGLRPEACGHGGAGFKLTAVLQRTVNMVMKRLGVRWRVWLGGVLFALLSACSSQMAPESNFVLLDGSRVSTSQWRGKVTLVNFWATSCTTCVAEMPQITSTYQRYHGQGFETVAVAMSYDPPSYVVNFAQTRQLPFQVAIDNTGEIAKAWDDVKLTPTTFLLDKQGTIVKRYVGAPNFSELHQLIEKLLAAS